jgi:hypothetical protein
MIAVETVILIGATSAWPDHLDEDLRRSGFAPTHADCVQHVGLLARHDDIRAIVVHARTLDFGDIVRLHRLRSNLPRLGLIVVGVGETTKAMHDALDADATSYVSRGLLSSQLIEVLHWHQDEGRDVH